MNYEIKGTYGSNLTPCTVYVSQDRRGGKWYACEDSVNVNYTFDDIDDGVNVEELQDVDMFTWPARINSLTELIEAIEA